MADGLCAEEAASDLGDGNRVPRERHKRDEPVNAETDFEEAVCVVIGDVDACASDRRDAKSVDEVSLLGSVNAVRADEVVDEEEEEEDEEDDDEEEEVVVVVSRSVTPSLPVHREVEQTAPRPMNVVQGEGDVVRSCGETATAETRVEVAEGGEKIGRVFAAEVPGTTRSGGAAAGVGGGGGKEGGVVVGSPFKGQIRTAEDTLVGPCGKKRCADRYDSSESSDSGVAVSCGECSSSGTSDITEPGSPCSTSSDEGVAIRATAPSPIPSPTPSPLPLLPKLAPPTPPSHHPPSRGPQWPWTPPLAVTACSTFKRLKGEPEAGTLPKAGAADPTPRSKTITGGKTHHEAHQGKITEYFKTQIKPQQVKVKKIADMSVLVAKSSPEFRRPPTVQRNKGGLAKYLGTVPPNGRPNDWEVRTLTVSPPPSKKPPVVVPRANSKIEKLPKIVPGLPISNNVLSTLPAVKLSSLRLPSEASPTSKSIVPPATPTPSLAGEPIIVDFKDNILIKPIVNENNNLTSSILASRSQSDPLSRLSLPGTEETKKDGDASQEPKAPLSPILSAPTTIRFPAQAPGKHRPQTADSGICRWDKCEAMFESSSGLLEHLQVAHINTQTGGDNFVCQWQGCKVQGRTSCSRRWLERHVLSHGGNKPFRCIVDGCGSRFSSQTALERHVNGHFNQPETSSSSSRRSCENGGKLVRRNGKRLRYRRQPWSARLFDYFDTGVMEGLHHRLMELARTRTQGRLAETPGNSMTLTSQVLARRVELDGKTRVLLRWYPQDIAPDEWVLESEVQKSKHVGIRKASSSSPEEVSLALYPAMSGGNSPQTRIKQRRKPAKNS